MSVSEEITQMDTLSIFRKEEALDNKPQTCLSIKE